jgi:hypothetical protein
MTRNGLKMTKMRATDVMTQKQKERTTAMVLAVGTPRAPNTLATTSRQHQVADGRRIAWWVRPWQQAQQKTPQLRRLLLLHLQR